MTVLSGGLPEIGPFSWAVAAGTMLFTAQIPYAKMERTKQATCQAQAGQACENLRKTLEVAGGSVRDIVQLTVYLTDVGEARGTTERWKRYFSRPWPNRATVGVNALTIPGIRIEITATAVLRDTRTGT